MFPLLISRRKLNRELWKDWIVWNVALGLNMAAMTQASRSTRHPFRRMTFTGVVRESHQMSRIISRGLETAHPQNLPVREYAVEHEYA